MYCINCGKKIVEGACFCQECGTKVKWPEPEEQSEEAFPDKQDLSEPEVLSEQLDQSEKTDCQAQTDNSNTDLPCNNDEAGNKANIPDEAVSKVETATEKKKRIHCKTDILKNNKTTEKNTKKSKKHFMALGVVLAAVIAAVFLGVQFFGGTAIPLAINFPDGIYDTTIAYDSAKGTLTVTESDDSESSYTTLSYNKGNYSLVYSEDGNTIEAPVTIKESAYTPDTIEIYTDEENIFLSFDENGEIISVQSDSSWGSYGFSIGYDEKSSVTGCNCYFGDETMDITVFDKNEKYNLPIGFMVSRSTTSNNKNLRYTLTEERTKSIRKITITDSSGEEFEQRIYNNKGQLISINDIRYSNYKKVSKNSLKKYNKVMGIMAVLLSEGLLSVDEYPILGQNGGLDLLLGVVSNAQYE